MKTFKAKSSVGRWAKKNIGENWKELGTVEKNKEGFYFSPTVVEPVAEPVVAEPEAVSETPVMGSYYQPVVSHDTSAAIKKVKKGKKGSTVVKKDLKGKSTIGSPCRIVWDVTEEMEGAKRKDIIAECVSRGVAFYTARTQYQKYTEAMKAMANA